MAKIFTEITPELRKFIGRQKFFVIGTAADEGRMNISPKGMDTLRVASPFARLHVSTLIPTGFVFTRQNGTASGRLEIPYRRNWAERSHQ